MSSPTLERTATPGIYKRGNRYVVVFRDPAGRQKKRFAATLKEARRVKAAMVSDVARGEYREVSRLTFGEYAATWLDTYAGRTSKGIREETRIGYRRVLEQDAIPFLGRMRLAEIEARDLDALALKVAGRGVKPNTVRLVLAPVKALLATAHERGEIRSNPAAGYRTRYTSPTVDVDPGDEPEQVKALSESELAAILEHVPGEWRLFFELLVQTGLRIGEAIELRWKDLELGVGAGTMQVQRRFYRGRVAPPKTKYGRRKLSLSPGLVKALWALRNSTHPRDDELVFTADRGARIEPSNLMTRVLKPAAANAGVGRWVKDPKARGGRRAESWVGFHTFRHSCASILFRAGWNAAQVQRWLGHHKASFTLDTYIHLLEEDVPTQAFFDELGSGASTREHQACQADIYAPEPGLQPSRPVRIEAMQMAPSPPLRSRDAVGAR